MQQAMVTSSSRSMLPLPLFYSGPVVIFGGFLVPVCSRNGLIAVHTGVSRRGTGGWVDKGPSYALVSQRGARRRQLWEEGTAAS